MDRAKSINSLANLGQLLSGETPVEEAQTTPSKRKDPLLALVTLKLSYEKSGRKGKGVSIVRGFHHTAADLQRFASELKTLCGAGGTVKNDAIEIQGDHREKIAFYLRQKGFTVKG